MHHQAEYLKIFAQKCTLENTDASADPETVALNNEIINHLLNVSNVFKSVAQTLSTVVQTKFVGFITRQSTHPQSGSNQPFVQLQTYFKKWTDLAVQRYAKMEITAANKKLWQDFQNNAQVAQSIVANYTESIQRFMANVDLEAIWACQDELMNGLEGNQTGLRLPLECN